tara:strand:+ start:676 stop:1779 length:1104 start_codon:yes stop_codon:yes gene_type:complete
LDKKLKIAIIGSRGYPYVYSGYETLVRELSERLVKKGHKVRVYCHSSLFNKKPRFVNGIELVYTPSVETKFLSQIINSFFSFLHVCFSNIDIILVVNSANGPFGILTKIFRKKTCINVDGLEWLRPKWSGLGSIYFKIASKLSTIFFDKIITDSLEMNKVYMEKYGKKSTVIAYGSTMVNTLKDDFLKTLNLKYNSYYLVVGRLIPDNNVKLIIEGFLKSNSNKKIVVVGDVPYNDSYANQVKQINSDRLILTGYINCQEKLSQLYKNCFSYLHGHEFGGTNPTMINALFFNCQILALKTPFSNEMLEGREKFLFKKKTESISKCITDFEKNFYYIKKINSKYKMQKKYNWNEIYNQYTKLFYSLIN